MTKHVIIPQQSAERIARFWARVDKRGGKKSCWPWQGSIGRGGYGHIGIGARQYVDAHRLAYAVKYGSAAIEGRCVCHHCDNRPCCNPAHLFVGSRLDNQRDMARKDRSAYGERHIGTKLTEKRVASLRQEHADGAPSRQLAKKYGVTRGNVDLIVRGVTWKRAPGPVRASRWAGRKQ